MNERQLLLVQSLLSNSKMNITQIAKNYNKSRKTIYNDIDTINFWLKSENIGSISKNELGILYIKTNNNLDILKAINARKEKLQTYSIDERRAYILFIIIENPFVSIDGITKTLNVSKTSIVNDINDLKSIFLSHDIKLIYSKKQYFIKGDEYKVRGFLTNMLSPFSHKFLKINISFPNYIRLISSSIANLSAYIQQKRISQGFYVNYSISDKDNLFIDDYLVFTNNFDNQLEKEYYALLLKGFSRSTNIKNKNAFCVLIIEKLILSFSSILSYSYDRKTEDVLYNHFESAIYRLSLGIILKNSVFEDIENNYRQAYNLAKLTLTQFIKNESFVKEESSFLAVLLLSQSFLKTEDKIVVVSHLGSSVAFFIKQQLIRLSVDPNLIIVCTDKEDITLYSNIYLIVTTFNLDSKINQVIVSPVFTLEDKSNIYKYLKKQDNFSIDTDSFLNVVKNNVNKKTFNLIISQINAIYKQGDVMLKCLIQNDTIRIKEECSSWQDAVKQVAEPLLQSGSISDNYIHATIENISKNGAYVVLRDGFALPHAKAGEFVNKIGMSLLVLKNAVSFSNDNENMVHVIVMLAATDHKSHLLALSELVDLVSDDVTFNQIKEAKTNKAILKVINKEGD